MTLSIKAYEVRYLSKDGANVGTVYARTQNNADSQVRQMYGPVYLAILRKDTPAAQPKAPKPPKDTSPNAFGPGQKAAITKQLLKLAEVA